MADQIFVSIIEKEIIAGNIIEKEIIPVDIIEKELAPINIVSPGDQGPPGPPLSIPPSGCKKVKNLYVNQAGKFVIEYEDTPV